MDKENSRQYKLRVQQHFSASQQQQSTILSPSSIYSTVTSRVLRTHFQPLRVGESQSTYNDHNHRSTGHEETPSAARIRPQPHMVQSSLAIPMVSSSESSSSSSPSFLLSHNTVQQQSPEMQMIFHNRDDNPATTTFFMKHKYYNVNDHQTQYHESPTTANNNNHRMDCCSNPVALTLLQNAEMDEMQEDWDQCMSLSTTYSSLSDADPPAQPPSHLRSHLEIELDPSGTILIRPNAIRAPFTF
jgi:hypothetical protein